MNYTHIHARQTGRTTRMLNHVLELVLKGHMVYVLCTPETVPNMRRRVAELMAHNQVKKELRKVECVTVGSLGQQNIDWTTQQVRGQHENCRTVIDHQVWETYFGYAINGYHHYDNHVLVKVDHIGEVKDWLYTQQQSSEENWPKKEWPLG